jgi:hypothetical protein
VANGYPLKGRSDAAIFVVKSGQIRHISSPAVFEAQGYHADNVGILPNGALASLATGTPIA